MPLIKFATLLDRAVRKCGLDARSLSQGLADNFADWLQDRVTQAWLASVWPDTVATEQRAFAPAWVAQSYADKSAVFYLPGLAYYQANGSVTSGQVPGTDVAWVAYSPPRWISFTQTGQTQISEPLWVGKQDPRGVRAPVPIGFWHDGSTLFLDPHPSVSQPWIQFRRMRPQFSATAYDVTHAYAADDLFLWTDGHCYLVLATTTAGDTPVSQAAKFSAQACPEVLADYAVRAAKADWLSDDGQDDKSAESEVAATRWLDTRLADLVILQRQTANYSAKG